MWCDKLYKNIDKICQEKENILPTMVILKKMARQQNKIVITTFTTSPNNREENIKHEGGSSLTRTSAEWEDLIPEKIINF